MKTIFGCLFVLISALLLAWDDLHVAFHFLKFFIFITSYSAEGNDRPYQRIQGWDDQAKDDNRSLKKDMIKFTRDNMELHEGCLSFMREQVEDLNLDITVIKDNQRV
jgi:hypothetical protein